MAGADKVATNTAAINSPDLIIKGARLFLSYSFIERFKWDFREEVLDMYVFTHLSEVPDLAEKWLIEYNEERPHESLGNMTPFEDFGLQQSLENSNCLFRCGSKVGG